MPYVECEPQESALGPVASECDQLDKPHPQEWTVTTQMLSYRLWVIWATGGARGGSSPNISPGAWPRWTSSGDATGREPPLPPGPEASPGELLCPGPRQPRLCPEAQASPPRRRPR